MQKDETEQIKVGRSLALRSDSLTHPPPSPNRADFYHLKVLYLRLSLPLMSCSDSQQLIISERQRSELQGPVGWSVFITPASTLSLRLFSCPCSLVKVVPYWKACVLQIQMLYELLQLFLVESSRERI
jgi:hypothetical protein